MQMKVRNQRLLDPHLVPLSGCGDLDSGRILRPILNEAELADILNALQEEAVLERSGRGPPLRVEPLSLAFGTANGWVSFFLAVTNRRVGWALGTPWDLPFLATS